VPRAILLDLDGTLIDSRPGIAASCAAALRALGHTPDPAFDITPLIGPPLPQVIRRLLQPHGDDRVDAGMAAYRAHYGETGLHMATIYPGITDALTQLSSQAICFVATAKRAVYASRIVDSLGLAAWFGGVYGTGLDGRLDDKADLIAAILRAEKLDPRDTIMVGDRSHDMIGARANGMSAIGVLWGYGNRAELEAAGADALAASPAALSSLCLP
jgi:phosphoglycolate phosphatase